MGVPKRPWFFKNRNYNELSLTHLKNEPQLYGLIYREVPIKGFYFGGECQFGYSLQFMFFFSNIFPYIYS